MYGQDHMMTSVFIAEGEGSLCAFDKEQKATNSVFLRQPLILSLPLLKVYLDLPCVSTLRKQNL